MASVAAEGSLLSEVPVDIGALRERFRVTIEGQGPATLWVLENEEQLLRHASIRETRAAVVSGGGTGAARSWWVGLAWWPAGGENGCSASGEEVVMSGPQHTVEQGSLEANGLTFGYLAAGRGPLALCLHGFPDSPYTYRHLLPALAGAGYRAVAPFARGFAPTSVPPDRHHVHTSTMVADQIALATALDGGPDAVLVAHDWGAVGAWGAASRAPGLWGRCVILNIPPFEIFGENLVTYSQIKKSFYFWYFQMQRVIEEQVRANGFAFVRDIWGEWSPGYEASEDVGYVAECLADAAHLQTALGYYWGQFDPGRFGSPEWAAEQAAAWGGDIPQPTLYLHGTRDGCHGMTQQQIDRVPGHAGPGSQAELIPGVGHFMLVERPEEINQRILTFLEHTT